jgi:alkylated DNA repair dioxygenase AlkB
MSRPPAVDALEEADAIALTEQALLCSVCPEDKTGAEEPVVEPKAVEVEVETKAVEAAETAEEAGETETEDSSSEEDEAPSPTTAAEACAAHRVAELEAAEKAKMVARPEAIVADLKIAAEKKAMRTACLQPTAARTACSKPAAASAAAAAVEATLVPVPALVAGAIAVVIRLINPRVCGAGDSWLWEHALISPSADELFQLLQPELAGRWMREQLAFRMFGRAVAPAHDSAYFSDSDSHLRGYSNLGPDSTHRFSPWLKATRDALETAVRLVVPKAKHHATHCVAIRYKTGADHIGYHQDAMADAEPGSAVVTLSLGATRRFLLRRDGEKQKPEELPLGAGCVFVMGPKTNALWAHSIAQTRKVVGERLALTFRAVKASGAAA